MKEVVTTITAGKHSLEITCYNGRSYVVRVNGKLALAMGATKAGKDKVVAEVIAGNFDSYIAKFNK